MKECPVCKNKIKQLNSKHISKCFGDDKAYRVKFINHNFPLTKDVNFLRESYENQKDSIPILCKKVGGLDFKSMVYLLNFFSIKVRSIKETRVLKEYKERKDATCIKKYGAVNPLSRGTEPFHKRNKTVIDKYGVENVWQCIDDFIDSYGSRSKISSLNNRISKILELSGIDYEPEFKIKYEFESKVKWKFYDFRIGNYLLEINGDYWHANPSKFKESDVFKFPKKELRAKEIWDLDKYKKEIAEDCGFNVIYLWESDINKTNDEQILQIIKNKIN
jgi:hypothetical protein